MPGDRKKAKLIRPGAVRAEIDNSGRVAYLYDEASIARIRPVLEDLIRKAGTFDAHAGFRRLGAAAVVVVYELVQDDPLDVEIVVGPPLTESELSVGRWLVPQRARLDVPSGRLFLDSGDTLRAAFPARATDDGATIEVPPGEYLLTLYRMHGDQMDADGLVRDRHRGAYDVVVLTPAAETGPMTKATGWLPYVPEKVRLPWRKTYTVKGAAADGLVVRSDPGTVVTNLDHAVLNAIGARPGTRLKCRIGNVEFTTNFEVTPPETPSIQPAGAWWWADPDADAELLVIGNRALKNVKLHTAISVTALVGKAGAARPGRGILRGTQAFGFLIAGELPAIETTLDEQGLATIDARPGDDLLLSFVDDEPEVHLRLRLFDGPEALQAAAAEFSRLPKVTERELAKLIKELIRRRKTDTLKAMTELQLRRKIRALRYPDGPAAVPWGGLLVPCHSDATWKVLAVTPLVQVPGAKLLPPLSFLPVGGGGVTLRKP